MGWYSPDLFSCVSGAGADRYSLLRKGLDFAIKLKPHLLLHAGFDRRFRDVPLSALFPFTATDITISYVDEIVFSFDEIDEYNGRVFITETGQEMVKIRIEFKNMPLDNETKAAILHKLHNKIKETTQATMQVEEAPYGTLHRFEYKVRRWTDERVEGLERVKYVEKRYDSKPQN